MSSLDVTPHGYVIDVYPRGYSAYQVALQNGFVGTEAEWLASLVGTPGMAFDHVQAVAASVWTINHGFAAYPNVTVFDNYEVQQEGDIDHVTVNLLTITFAYPFSGHAVLS